MAEENLTKARLKRAATLIEDGRLLAGLQILEEILHFDPRGGYAWVEYARVLKELGRFDEAFGAYDKAISLAPEDVRGHLLGSVGLLVAEWRGPAQAAEWYQRAVDALTEPVAWVYILCGTNLYRLGRLDEAEASLLQAAEMDSDERCEALVNLAILYRAQGKYTEASKMAERASVADPESPLPRQILLSMER